MWLKSRPRRSAGFCGKQQREKNPVRKEETRPRSMSVLSEKTCPDNGGNLTTHPTHKPEVFYEFILDKSAPEPFFSHPEMF